MLDPTPFENEGNWGWILSTSRTCCFVFSPTLTHTQPISAHLAFHFFLFYFTQSTIALWYLSCFVYMHNQPFSWGHKTRGAVCGASMLAVLGFPHFLLAILPHRRLPSSSFTPKHTFPSKVFSFFYRKSLFNLPSPFPPPRLQKPHAFGETSLRPSSPWEGGGERFKGVRLFFWTWGERLLDRFLCPRSRLRLFILRSSFLFLEGFLVLV